MSNSRPLFAALCLLAAFSLGGCGSKPAQGTSQSSGAQSEPATTLTPDTSVSPGTTGGTLQAGVELGAQVFKQRCALCHGPEGRGDGPASAALRPPPRNFHDAAYMNSRSDDSLLTSIRNGKSAMPPWKNVLSDAEIRSALMYVRTFAGKP